MKSDVIVVTNTGKGMSDALEQAAASAAYRSLSGKDALKLRLLSEEMLGMVREITGETEAEFWLESDGRKFRLYLVAQPVITETMRKKLLSVSTDGKNAAAVGVMGKLRDIFERAFYASDMGDNSYYVRGLLLSAAPDGMDATSYNAIVNMADWSMQRYRATVDRERIDDPAAEEEWDELEKSIIANIADEVSISIRSKEVEMTVYKDFGEK